MRAFVGVTDGDWYRFLRLTQPFFFDRADWIPAPVDFSKNIVQGKT